jgi:serine/threonine-protein kinase
MSVSLAEGTVFAGRYQLVRCIASGGMGAVYEAIHLETMRRRALKVMHPHLFGSDEMRERFKLEARIAAQVESEFIVDVSDAGVDEATRMPFIVMELLRGEELGDRLKRVGRLPPHEVVTYLQQAAWALDRTHAAQIVHRDLKPANLFLTQREDGSPRIKILDFGVAKLIAEGATSAGATRSLGTPLYMAPEQFRTGAGLTAAADVYALGMMAYTLLVGEAYWQNEARGSGNVIAFALAVQQGPIEPAVHRAASRGVMLPPSFEPWFRRVTALNPADRYPTASEAIRVLAEVLGIAPGAASVPLSSGLSGSHTPVGAPLPPAAWPTPGSGAQPALPVAAGVGSSTGAAVAPAAAPAPRKSPALAIGIVLGAVVLGVGGVLGVRAVAMGPRAAPNPAPPAAAPLPSVQPSHDGAASGPNPRAPAETSATATSAAAAAPTDEPAAPTASAAAPTASAAAKDEPPAPKPTSAPAAAKAPAAKPTATAAAKAPAKSGAAPAAPLLGRD